MGNQSKNETRHKYSSLSLTAQRSALILKWLARIFVLIITVQVFFAGLALFVGMDWTLHKLFARCFIIFPVLMLLVTFIGRLPYRVKCIQLLVMVILMFATADLSPKIGLLSALHPVIALAMFWTAMTVTRQSNAKKVKRN
jgi:hypothetical protein